LNTSRTAAAAGVGLPNGTSNHNDTIPLVSNPISQSVVVPETSKENGK